MDLSHLSDAELDAMIAEKQGNDSDLSSLSDEQLDAMIAKKEADLNPTIPGTNLKLNKAEESFRRPLRAARAIASAPGALIDALTFPIREMSPEPIVGGAAAPVRLPGVTAHRYTGEMPIVSDIIKKKIDEKTQNRLAPRNAYERIEDAVKEDLATLPFGVGAGKLLQKAPGAFQKVSKYLTNSNKLTPANVASSVGASTLGQGALEAFPENPEIAMGARLIGGAAAHKNTERALLSKSRKEAIKERNIIKRAERSAKVLGIDLEALARDQALGIEGTLSRYSKHGFIKTHELQQRRNPFTEGHYKKVDLQNIERYKELLQMKKPYFAELEPQVGGELLQKGATKRKAQRELEHHKLFEDIHEKIPTDAVIPEEMVKGKVGQHIFKEVEKLTPSERKARLAELQATEYLKRLANSSQDLKGKSLPNDLLESLSKEHPSIQAAVLKQLGLEDLDQPKNLQDAIGALQYHSAKSIKDSLGNKTKKHFGLISDKNPAANKQLYGQLSGIEDQFLHHNFPDVYNEKQAANALYKKFKKEEAPIINSLLGSEINPVTPEKAFSKATTSVHQNKNFITHAQEYLTPDESEMLSLSALKQRAKKNIQGDITATSFAKGFNNLTDSVKEVYLSPFSKHQRENFLNAVDSIMNNRAAEALENTSGTSHHEAHRGLIRGGKEAIGSALGLNFSPLIHFLTGEIIFPRAQAKKLFTNQNFLRNINKLSDAKTSKEAIRYGNLLMKNTSFKKALTKSYLRMKVPGIQEPKNEE